MVRHEWRPAEEDLEEQDNVVDAVLQEIVNLYRVLQTLRNE